MTRTTVRALASLEPGGSFQPFSFDLGPIGPEEVEIDVISCGVCHSDLSMNKNDWGMTAYPFVPGHEIIGKVAALGAQAKGLKVGQKVGLGWFSESCMHCDPCMGGHHNLCLTRGQTIVGRFGGFAEKVRAHWSWVIPLPGALDVIKAGPLFCAGITVFEPIAEFGVKPTDRVGVIGIGGLGHLALQFFNKWGCEVTAFTSSTSKAEEALRLGAHTIVNSRSDKALEEVAGSYNFILSTVNVPLNWDLYLNALKPSGRFHLVGAVTEPMLINAFSLIMQGRSMSGSPLGSPATIRKMLKFCAHHDISPMIERFPMSKADEAFERLEAGKARYRIVLENDF